MSAEAPDTKPASSHQARKFHLTDFGNAERLVDRDGDDLRFVRGLGWHCWDCRRFRLDETGEVERRAKRVVREIYLEAAAETDPEERDRLVKHAQRSEQAGRLRAMISLAESEREVVARVDDLDADPFALTVSNGTIDLRTGDLRPHRREDLITKQARVDYVEGARHELFDRFIAETTAGHDGLAEFVQRAMGYTMTGSTAEEVLFFAHGPQATGKTTLLEATRTMLGEHSMTTDFETFTKKRGDGGIRADVARLVGARLVTGVEVDRGKALAEGLVKQVTGGDRISARMLYQNPIEFTPTFKIWLAANHRPRVDAHDGAMWRRIHLIPFTNVVPAERRDPEVKRRLRSDPDVLSAMLSWAVEGCLEWQRRGLEVPVCVSAFTESYRLENDPLREFVQDVCEVDPRASSSAKQLRAAYERWADAAGEEPLNTRAWGDALRAVGAERTRVRGQRAWRGIGLREGDD